MPSRERPGSFILPRKFMNGCHRQGYSRRSRPASVDGIPPSRTRATIRTRSGEGAGSRWAALQLKEAANLGRLLAEFGTISLPRAYFPVLVIAQVEAGQLEVVGIGAAGHFTYAGGPHWVRALP